MKTRKLLLLALGSGMSLSLTNDVSAIVVTQDTNGTSLANAVINAGSGLMVTGTTLQTQDNGGGAVGSGTYSNASGTYGIGDGIILSSGNVSHYADGPNTVPDNTTSYGIFATPAQEALLDPITGGSFDHRDVVQFDIAFDVDANTNNVFFNVTFGSEEFPEFVGSNFIDGFGLYLNGTNIAFVGGQPVNINHTDMSGLVPGTELDGILAGAQGAFGPFVHTFSAPVTPGSVGNTLTFIIADTSDFILDTTVYISQLGGTPPPPPPPPGGGGVPEPVTSFLALMGIGALGARLSHRRAV